MPPLAQAISPEDAALAALGSADPMEEFLGIGEGFDDEDDFGPDHDDFSDY